MATKREQIKLPVDTQLSFFELEKPSMVMSKAITTPKETFPNFKKGYSAFGMNNGSFSFGDVIAHVLDEIGPAHALISTWVASQAATEKVCHFMNDDRFLSVRFLVDRMFSESRRPVYDYIVNNFGADSIRTTRSHAKFCVLYNDKYKVVIETSANLNKNTRLETFRITEDEQFCEFFVGIFDEFFNVTSPGENTKLSSAQKSGSLKESGYGQESKTEQSAFKIQGYEF